MKRGTRSLGKETQDVWRAWHVPLSRVEVALGNAYGSLEAIGACASATCR